MRLMSSPTAWQEGPADSACIWCRSHRGGRRRGILKLKQKIEQGGEKLARSVSMTIHMKLVTTQLKLRTPAFVLHSPDTLLVVVAVTSCCATNCVLTPASTLRRMLIWSPYSMLIMLSCACGTTKAVQHNHKHSNPTRNADTLLQ